MSKKKKQEKSLKTITHLIGICFILIFFCFVIVFGYFATEIKNAASPSPESYTFEMINE